MPQITADDIAAVKVAAEHGWGERRDFHVLELQEKLKKITTRKFALAVSHGTDAIHLALASLDLNPGDEVIVPDLTWVACIAPIIHLGLVPVLANSNESLCLDPDSLLSAITSRTKAVIVVDLAGSLPDWDRINQIAHQYGLAIIEDAAESLGGRYKGAPAGSFGDISILSFSGTKVVTGGHGGAVLTNSKNLHERMKLAHHHGIDQSLTGKYYWSTEAGYNFQISNLQAALVASQLSRLESLVGFKKWLFQKYSKQISDASTLQLLSPPSEVESSHWLVVANFNHKNLTKERLIELAASEGIELRPFFYLLSAMPPFSDLRVEEKFKRNLTRDLSNNCICLPYGYDMTEEKVSRVVKTIEKILEENE